MNCFICLGASFIIKKKALVQISLGSGRRAANGGYGYLTNWLWWFGLSLSKTFFLYTIKILSYQIVHCFNVLFF